MDEDAINEVIEDTTVGIYVLKVHASSDEPEDIGIVLEGIKVLTDLDNVALAVAILFGLMYALNLNYPADPRYTFEAIQKIFMELDGALAVMLFGLIYALNRSYPADLGYTFEAI